jgi:hypothetical protein
VKFAKSLGMKPDKWQTAALRSTAPRVLLNIHRQGGKTTTTAILTTHTVVYKPNSLVLIVSPTQRQSTELFRKVLNYYRQLGKPVESEAENMLSLVLENGSRVISVPGSEAGIRGYSADLVLIDEAARVPDSVFEAVSPMLAVTGGRLIVMSTPAGRRGFYYEASMSDRWEKHTVIATECPRISAEFLEDEHGTLGELSYRQEYLCEFVDAAGAAFTGDDIDAIWGGCAPPRSEPHPVAEVARMSEPERVALEQQRYMSGLTRQRGSRERARALGQKLCQHRWSPDRSHCMWCDKQSEETKAC